MPIDYDYYIDYFENKNQFYTIQPDFLHHYDPFIYSETIKKLIRELQENNILIPLVDINLKNYSKFINSKHFDNANLSDIKNIMTVIFKDGIHTPAYLATIIDRGYLLKILRKLKEIT